MAKDYVQATQTIESVIELCNKMLELANSDDSRQNDSESEVFYAALRNSAYKIRRLAKNELIRYETKWSPLA